MFGYDCKSYFLEYILSLLGLICLLILLRIGGVPAFIPPIFIFILGIFFLIDMVVSYFKFFNSL